MGACRLDELRFHGCYALTMPKPAKAVYKRNPEFSAALTSSGPDRAAPARRALQMETEIRQHPALRVAVS